RAIPQILRLLLHPLTLPTRRSSDLRRPAGAPHRPRSPAGRREAAGKIKDPQIVEDLRAVAAPATGGDPMSAAQYVRRSLRTPSEDRKSTRLNSSPVGISYAVFRVSK